MPSLYAMKPVLRIVAPLFALSLLSACAQEGGPLGGVFSQSEPAPVEAPAETTEQPVEAVVETVEIGEGGATAEALDTTTEAEKAAVTNVSVPASGLLGETVATLGDPAQPGFWLKTPLVKTERVGRIEREGGAVAQVTLIPLEGEATSGSQISLSAMRALDIGLTDFATLKVYAN